MFDFWWTDSRTDPTKKNSSIQLCYAGFVHSDWLLEYLPIRALKNEGRIIPKFLYWGR